MKKYVALLLLCIFSFAFSGCTGKKKPVNTFIDAPKAVSEFTQECPKKGLTDIECTTALQGCLDQQKKLQSITLDDCLEAAEFALKKQGNGHKDGQCNIKGNISKGDATKGDKIYHLPFCPSYDDIVIEPWKGEKIFCSEEEAKKEGFRKSGNCP